ncbi:hypothetical protein FB381_3022 [Nocardioides albertanoniae]|uniref:Uncharacterized protein n=1 Tax=Nocardioides albertanoniae TaxID=1175486 RepID=A0A543A9E1_9ACTN|nr:hypothetical protein [Nocardioides albertanoniae]TQL69120.1 hypothetical protein FB381_3022 [Nocardioides albertanoniae]
MAFSTITGERDDIGQRSMWNGASPQSTWQESSWGKRIGAIAAVLVPIGLAVALVIRNAQAGESK